MLFHVLHNSVSLEFSPEVTHDGDHVADKDTEDVENQGSQRVKSKILLQLRESEEIHVSRHGSL